MNRKIIVAALAVCCVASASADQYTRSYVRKDGTLVQGHYSTQPNSTTLDNYSTRGNVNPYTGQAGTIDPYRQVTPAYQPPPQQRSQQNPWAPQVYPKQYNGF